MNEKRLHNGVKVDTDTANGLTRAIIDTVNFAGGLVWRQNVVAVRGRATHCKGIPDVVGMFGGRFIGVEVKIGRDKQSVWQDEFERKCKQAGGVYIVAHTFEEFAAAFDTLKRQARATEIYIKAFQR